MKKIIFFFLLLLSTSLVAQKHYVGALGGIGTTNVTSNTDDNTRFNLNFLGGIAYEYIFESNVVAEVDLLYYGAGFNMKSYSTNGTTIGSDQMNYDYDYLGLPLKVGYKIGRNFSYKIKLGVMPSYLIKAKHISPKEEYAPPVATSQSPQRIAAQNEILDENLLESSECVRKFDFAGLIEFGLSYEFENNINIGASALYKHSVTSITSNVDCYDGTNYYNYGFSFLLGLKYRL